MKYTKIQNLTRLLMAGACFITAGSSRGAEFWLRTGVVTNAMPDGRAVVMWAFAQDSANWAVPGALKVPGPQLAVAQGDSLTIHVTNTLPEPVSIIIPGQYAFTGHAPAFHAGDPYAGRVRSLTAEAAPLTGVATYRWTSVQGGSFLYHSASHLSVQVQMGLFGALSVLAPGPQIYGLHFDALVPLIFSEIDPDLHDAVAGGSFGPGPAFQATDFSSASAATFIAAVNASSDPVAVFIASLLTTNNTSDPGILISDLNTIVGGPSIYDPGVFPDTILSAATLAQMKQKPPPSQNYPTTFVPFNGNLVRMNRALLQDGLAHAGIAFPAVKAMTSAIRARAQYFLINGQAYTNGQPTIPAANATSNTLVSLFNACMDAREVTFNNAGDLQWIAQDGQGQPDAFVRSGPMAWLPALKTRDALWAPAAAGTYAVYDRHMGLQSGPNLPGGMLAYLAIPGPTTTTTATLAIVRTPGGLQLTVISAPGAIFVIEMSNDLIQWSPVATVTNVTGVLNYPLINTGAPAVFYRARLLGSGATVASIAVLVPPTDQSVPEFSTATWTVVASGSGLAYQWLRNGAAISGATGPSYSLANLNRTNSGEQFSVTVSGTGGSSVTSSPVTLTVVPAAPTIVTQPAGITMPPAPGSMWVVAAGSEPMTYQWFKGPAAGGPWTPLVNGGAISGAATSNLVFSVASPTNGGFYQVVVAGPVVSTPGVFVAGAGATVTSLPAELRIGPAIPANQPVNVTVADRANATFSVAATGTGLTYQWYRQAPGGGAFSLIAGATGSSYTLTPAYYLVDNQSHYQVVVTGDTGQSVTSRSALLTVNPPPDNSVVFLTAPTSLTVTAGVASVSFTAAVDASQPTFTWWRGNNNGGWNEVFAGNNVAAYFTITTAGNTSTLTVAGPSRAPINLGQAGTYEVRVASPTSGSAARASAGLTVSQTFAGAPITIPLAGGTATPYPATTAPVPTLTGAEIKHASVSMILSSDEPFDVNALLVPPPASPTTPVRNVVFMSGLGPRPTEITSLTNPELGLPHQYAVTNCALTFDDSAPAPVSTNYWLNPGTYQPSIHPWDLPLVSWPAPAPGIPYAMTFSNLNALTVAQGQWRLYVNDTVGNAGVDLASPVGVDGRMNPWSLTLTAGPLGGPPPPPLPLAAPQTPVHISPGNSVAGTLVNTFTPTYTFSMVAGATQYMIVLRNVANGGFTDYPWLTAAQVDPGNTGTGSYTQPTPLAPGTYVWFVLAGNAAGISHFDTSGLAFATPGAGAVSPVQGISPNGPVSTNMPTYTFTLSPQVQQYQIQYTDATGVSTVLGPFQTVNVAGGTIPTNGTYSIVQPTPLAHGAYTWVVQSEIAAGWVWSYPLPFTVP